MKKIVIGKSRAFRAVECTVVGQGGRHLFYIGGLAASEREISDLLTRWAEALTAAERSDGRINGYNLSTLLRRCTVHVIPCLNPDGRALREEGIAEDSPFRDRILKINGGKDDFSRWESNFTGTDLRRNFNASWIESKREERANRQNLPAPWGYGGEFPESEPETAALCRYAKTMMPQTVWILGQNGETLHCADRVDCRKKTEVLRPYCNLPICTDPWPSGSCAAWAEQILGAEVFEVSAPENKVGDLLTFLTVSVAV